ncbi:MAG: glutathione S-transferase family protein [Pseudomonadota bacterium]
MAEPRATPRLIGFADSVFTRAAQMGLHLDGRAYEFEAVNPFEPAGQQRLAPYTPFGRVPVWVDGAFVCYEAPAILRALSGDLFPSGRAGARVLQVSGIVQSDVYTPLVRHVFAHGVYRARHGLDADGRILAEGLRAAPHVLGALDQIAAEGLVLDRTAVTAADCLLAPMLAAFVAVPDGATMLHGYTALQRWYAWICAQAVFQQTTPPWAEG